MSGPGRARGVPKPPRMGYAPATPANEPTRTEGMNYQPPAMAKKEARAWPTNT